MTSLLLFSVLTISTALASAEPRRVIKTPTGFFMVLRQGDKLFPTLEAWAEKEKIPSATFTGFGFVNIKFGFFDFKTKEYKPKDFKSVELASLNGSLAWQNGKPSLHAHGVVTDESFQAFGGHILEAEVGTGSLEITVTTRPQKLERKLEEPLGANVLSLEETKEWPSSSQKGQSPK